MLNKPGPQHGRRHATVSVRGPIPVRGERNHVRAREDEVKERCAELCAPTADVRGDKHQHHRIGAVVAQEHDEQGTEKDQ